MSTLTSSGYWAGCTAEYSLTSRGLPAAQPCSSEHPYSQDMWRWPSTKGYRIQGTSIWYMFVMSPPLCHFMTMLCSIVQGHLISCVTHFCYYDGTPVWQWERPVLTLTTAVWCFHLVDSSHTLLLQWGHFLLGERTDGLTLPSRFDFSELSLCKDILLLVRVSGTERDVCGSVTLCVKG